VHAANQPVRHQRPKECAVENYFYCHEGKRGERTFLGETFWQISRVIPAAC
jgi:hypothetical protein